MVPIVWIGGQNAEGNPNDVTVSANWSSPFSGEGDNVFFGDTGTREVYIGTNIAVGNVEFGNGSSTAFDIHGDNDGSSLWLGGSLTADPGSNATFHSDLDIYLASGTHQADIGSAATIKVESDIADDYDATTGIDKTGDGTLVLSGTNTFSGGVSVHAGTLVLGHDSNYDGMIYSSAVGLGTLKLYSGSTLSMEEEYSYHLYNDIDLDCSGGTVTVDVPVYSQLTLNSYIYGSAGLSKQGSGTLVLNNSESDFSGGVSVHEGTLLLGTSSGTGDGYIWGPVGGGTLKLYDGTTLGVSTSSSTTLHNAIDLDCRSTAEVTVQTQTEQSLTLAGNISGAAELTKTGSGSLTLTGDNSFTGDLYVNGGTLNIGSNTGAGLGALEMGISQGTVNFTTLAPVIHGLSADNANDDVNLASGSTLTINQDENSTFAGHLDGHGGASIVKSGTGALTFSQSNDYDGSTTISGGTLVYGATGAFGTSTVTINGGALKIANGATFSNNLTLTSGKLAGNFSFTTPQTFGSGVTLSPGNSPGTISFTSLTVNDGLATDFEFNAATGTAGTVNDLIAVSGTLDLSAVSAGGYTLRLISLMADNNPGAVPGLTGPTSWTIFTAGTLTGFANGGTQFTLDSTQFYGGGIFTISQSGQNLLLNFTPVPEPSTYALMALGLATTGLAAWRRRRA